MSVRQLMITKDYDIEFPSRIIWKMRVSVSNNRHYK